MTNRLHATIANTQFDGILTNASGVHCQNKEELDELLASKDVATAVTKSSTKEFRPGNPRPSYYEFEQGSINSMGLPNNGFDYYLDYVCQDHSKKPVILSVASLSMAEGIELLHRVQDSDFEGITEFNLSCPNVVGKPQVAYDFEMTEKILKEVFSFFTKPLGVKLPPYFDFAHFDKMAEILNQFPLSHINSINSIGNGLYVDIDSESSVIKPKKGFGGLGGAMVLPTALANVRAFRERLNDDIRIIGTGGVTTGEDVFAHLLCGADLISIGTELQRQGIGLFEKLNRELLEIMDKKGYHSVEEFRSKLKSIE